MTVEDELQQLRKENGLLRKENARLVQTIEGLQKQMKELQDRLAKDSHNSSLPPSSDRFVRQKKTKSLRKKSGKKVGGQSVHPGHTLKLSATPDQVIPLPPVTSCQHCHADLSDLAAHTIERRQVIDVPQPRKEITEYQGEWKHCPHCS